MAGQRRASYRALVTRGHRTEDGVIALMLGLSLPMILAAMALLVDWGYRRSVEQELQNAADALAIAAGAKLREVGLGTGHPLHYDVQDLAPEILRGNLSDHLADAVQVHVAVRPHARQHADVVSVDLTLAYESPLRGLISRVIEAAVSGRTLVRRAYAILPSWTMGSRDWPMVLFVAHAAKPMAAHGADSDQSLWQLVSDALTALASRPLPMRPGLIIFRDARSPGQQPHTGMSSQALERRSFVGRPEIVRDEGPAVGFEREAITEDQLVRVAPPQTPLQQAGPITQALAQVRLPTGFTNLDLALQEAARMLGAYPTDRRVVILLTNDRLSYLLPSDYRMHCSGLVANRFFPRCVVYTSDGGVNAEGANPLELEQRKVERTAQLLRTLPGGVALHVVRMQAKDWLSMVASLLGMGQLGGVISELADALAAKLGSVLSPTQSRQINEEFGIPLPEDFLVRLAGGPLRAEGGDESYVITLARPGAPDAVLQALMQPVCRFDPLASRADGETADASVTYARFAFLRDAAGHETRLPLVAAGYSVPDLGYELIVGRRLEIALTPAACSWLGTQERSSLVLRWGIPRLISAEAGQETL